MTDFGDIGGTGWSSDRRFGPPQQPPTPPPFVAPRFDPIAAGPSQVGLPTPITTEATSVDPTVEAATVPETELPDADQPTVETRRNPWNVVMVIVCAVLVLGAATLAVVSRTVFSDASHIRGQAVVLDRHTDQVRAQGRRADALRTKITSETAAIDSTMTDLGTAMDAAVDAENHFTDITNQAADLYNQGQIAASVALLKSQGDPALADLAQKSAAADKAITAAQAAAQNLKETLHG